MACRGPPRLAVLSSEVAYAAGGWLAADCAVGALLVVWFMTDPGRGRDDLRPAFDQPNDIAEVITRLVVADALLGKRNARRLSRRIR